VSLTRRPPFAPRKIPGTRFCWRLRCPQHIRSELGIACWGGGGGGEQPVLCSLPCAVGGTWGPCQCPRCRRGHCPGRVAPACRVSWWGLHGNCYTRSSPSGGAHHPRRASSGDGSPETRPQCLMLAARNLRVLLPQPWLVRALVVAARNLRVLLPQTWLVRALLSEACSSGCRPAPYLAVGGAVRVHVHCGQVIWTLRLLRERLDTRDVQDLLARPVPHGFQRTPVPRTALRACWHSANGYRSVHVPECCSVLTH
jgi:hypothetical protein